MLTPIGYGSSVMPRPNPTDKRYAAAADALKKLELSSVQSRASRKAAAWAKLQQLKDQFKRLLTLSRLGTKGNGPAAAAMAKQLAAAVREYASAGGGAAGVESATPNGEQQPVKNEAAATVAQMVRTANLGNEDQKFLNEAKTLFKYLKTMLEQAAKLARSKGNHAESERLHAVAKESEQEISKAEKAVMQEPPSQTATYTASGEAAALTLAVPLLNVTA